MSNDRAIAAVTATLKRNIFQMLSTDPELSGAQVTARPPDRARTEAGAGNQINLFLYRTSLDAAWRNQDPPGLRPGEQGQPALPLVLSYLLTAYGENDDEVLSHRLLGLGMRVLHDQPLLLPAAIAAAMPGSGLESQVERVRITPHPIPLDEISHLWATFQTGYRISVTYDVAVVLIESTAPVRAPLPVLVRGEGDTGPTVVASLAPVLTMAAAPGGRAAGQAGEQLALRGQHLGSVQDVFVTSPRLAKPRRLDPDTAAENEVRVTLPTTDPLPAGTVTVVVSARDGGASLAPDTVPVGGLASNEVPLGVAPVLTMTEPIRTRRTRGRAKVTVACTPPVGSDQVAALIVGHRVVPAEPPGDARAKSRSDLVFTLEGFQPGTYVLRLRVDGQDSIPLATDGHSFEESQTLVLS